MFLYTEDWKDKVLCLFPDGVDVVYESVGSTMKESLEVTRTRGQVVFFGLAGGQLDLGNPLLIIANSKTITGGDLWNYLNSAQERISRAEKLFKWMVSGQLSIAPPTIFKLSEGKKAHEFMESRLSTGKILLIP